MGFFDFLKPKSEPKNVLQQVQKPSNQPPAMKDHKDEMIFGEWSAGQTILADFVMERVLGEGGMGKVYLLKSKTTGMRFAVKRAKGLNDADRRNFLAELQTWIDLPEHPNLVPCRFFRTVGNEVLIFAEFVEGGSLKDWIDSGKLYEGGKAKALERILDTAIQFAWGLHCVHEMGLVHQDVKPANVMMVSQVAVQGLKPRVTDYGLARARAAAGERYEPELGRSILVSSGGYTPAYCSPEQLSSQKLDRSTDLWSWGVSVLEMFQGEVTWRSGSVAAEALESFLEHNGEEENIPAMPSEVAVILWGCFCVNLEDRWKTLEIVVQKLRAAYQTAVGTKYSPALGKIEHRTTPQVGAGERRTRLGTSWRDPRDWLERALWEEGRTPAESEAIVERLASSRRGQLVADVAAYDEARRIYERLIRCGRKDLENALATLCHDAASVHETADDTSGELALYDRAIEIRERLVNIEGRSELANDLASLYQNKAIVVSALGDKRAAVALYDQAIEIRERLVNVEGRSELANDLANLYMNKALAVSDLGDKRAAVALYDRAIEIRERLVNIEGRSELANALARLYMNKASAVSAVGDNRAAVALYDWAIEIYERLVNVEGRSELANDLATLYSSKALVVSDMGDNRAAVSLHDRAIEIFERMVNIEGRSELANDLASLYLNKANAVTALGDNHAAVALYSQAIEIRERLVNVEGRSELANGLARLYSNKALVVTALGDNRAAVALYDRAIKIYERLVNSERRSELANDLASLYMNKANAVSALGEKRAAVTLYDQAIEICERQVNVEGRSELTNDLAMLYQNKAVAVSGLGDCCAAVALYSQAIEIRERQVNVEGRSELANDLADLYQNKAVVVSDLGDNRAAVSLFDQAIEIHERLVNAEGRSELAGDLAWIKASRGLALIRLGETEKGEREAHNAMSVLRAEVDRTGRVDLKAVLDLTARQLGEQ